MKFVYNQSKPHTLFKGRGHNPPGSIAKAVEARASTATLCSTRQHRHAAINPLFGKTMMSGKLIYMCVSLTSIAESEQNAIMLPRANVHAVSLVHKCESHGRISATRTLRLPRDCSDLTLQVPAQFVLPYILYYNHREPTPARELGEDAPECRTHYKRDRLF
jgi:hypothetical protein